MKIAVILDPLESIKPYKDTSYAIMREAAKRGHSLHVLMQEDLILREGIVFGLAHRLKLTEDPLMWYHIDPVETIPLREFDAVLMRKDPPFDMEYIYSTYLLELAQNQGTYIFNNPCAIRDYNEKMAIAKFPEFTTPTMVSRNANEVRQFIEQHDDCILKPLDGMGGSNIFRVTPRDVNLNVILETFMHDNAQTIMAQRYIPEITKGDKRVLVIDGKPIPYALARIPKPGETRGNLARGGLGVAQPLSARDREIAETLGPKLKAEGLLLVGLDIIGDYLTEVNVTSPTCMREIEDQTGFSAAALMVDALERLSQQP